MVIFFVLIRFITVNSRRLRACRIRSDLLLGLYLLLGWIGHLLGILLILLTVIIIRKLFATVTGVIIVLIASINTVVAVIGSWKLSRWLSYLLRLLVLRVAVRDLCILSTLVTVLMVLRLLIMMIRLIIVNLSWFFCLFLVHLVHLRRLLREIIAIRENR